MRCSLITMKRIKCAAQYTQLETRGMWLHVPACRCVCLHVALCGSHPNASHFKLKLINFAHDWCPIVLHSIALRDRECQEKRERERGQERNELRLNLTEGIFRRNFVSVECVANGKSWKPKAESLIASLMRLPALWSACLLLHADLIGFYFLLLGRWAILN